MRSPIFDGEQDACYGCEACTQICSHNAITMVANEEGFSYPKIDESLCVHCELCKKVCPVQNSKASFHAPSKSVYAAWTKDRSIRMDSTSGAAFSELASAILLRKGVVYGCAWKTNRLTAVHTRIETESQLKRLRGSKYVQSEIGTTFQDAKKDLQRGRLVLYSGTPCQIAGLKLFLGKDYSNLYLIDLVCHGIPSPKIFKEYIQYIEAKTGETITNYKFRAKKNSGWRSYVALTNSKTINNDIMISVGFDPYSYAFHSSLLNRESCFQCDFSRIERTGDITLSDYWGGEKRHVQLRPIRKFGFSMIMCNSEKGKELTESILPKMDWIRSDAETAQANDIRLRSTGERPKLRSKIYAELNENGFAWLAENRFKPRFLFIRKLIPDVFKNLFKEIQTRIWIS